MRWTRCSSYHVALAAWGQEDRVMLNTVLEWWCALPAAAQTTLIGIVIGGAFALLVWCVSRVLRGPRAEREEKKRWLSAALEWRTSDSAPSFRGADLEGADLHGMSLRAGGLPAADLTGANLKRANLMHADLSSAILSGADLRRADMRYSILTDATLTHADLTKADLRYSHLSGASLWGATLAKADLRGAELAGARYLEHSSLRGAKYDDATTWPEGFIPSRGVKRRR